MSSRPSGYHHQGRLGAQGSIGAHAGDGRGHPGVRGYGPSAYTLAHGGRQLRIGPLAFWLVLGTLAIMALWTITTATYFAFREDVLTRLLARQTEMQYGYEDRIAELRAQVDRISSRQLLDQDQYEQKLDQILRRQTALESRANTLSGLGDVTSSIRQPARGGAAGDSGAAQFKPAPLNGKGALLLPRGRELSLDPRLNGIKSGGMSGAIAHLQASLDRVEQRQAAALDSLEENYLSRERRIRGVLKELGIDTGKPVGTDHAGAMGGPFVPPRAPKDANGFERQLHRISVSRIQIHRLARTLQSVPVRRPLEGETDLASAFGVRQDPFTGSPAMHTGLDIHAETGNPVRASADGTVTAAGWSGGYGRVVDVDHGNGFSTRYAHLSAIDVHAGQAVKTGQIVGKVGSTGRSTGPHLHYETRLRGEAVDPQKFLRAGARLDGGI
jgi:murein DD-endopeptidase MepM/ murein hydrolase activator NlpD